MSTLKRHIPGEAAIWVFIFGDMVMFSMFFGQFIYDRAHQLPLFIASQRTLSISFGALNTIILLTGSLFVVLGVEAAKTNYQKFGSPDSMSEPAGAGGGRNAATTDENQSAGGGCFVLTMVCAVIFGCDKVLEYADHLRMGVTPATNAFFMYYYMFTGIHALHLIISTVFLGRMLQLSRLGIRNAADIRFIESGAGFWHLVDLLWIALFAILYILP